MGYRCFGGFRLVTADSQFELIYRIFDVEFALNYWFDKTIKFGVSKL